jgi:hypothetical protein
MHGLNYNKRRRETISRDGVGEKKREERDREIDY